MQNDALLSALLSTWDVSLPATFGYSNLNATARGDITSSINAFYFGNEETPTIDLDRQQLMNVSQSKNCNDEKLKIKTFSCSQTFFYCLFIQSRKELSIAATVARICICILIKEKPVLVEQRVTLELLMQMI